MDWNFNFIREALSTLTRAGSLAETDATTRKDCQRLLEIIDSMTADERSNCDLLLDSARRARIARTAKVPLAEVDRVVAERQSLAIVLRKMREEEGD